MQQLRRQSYYNKLLCFSRKGFLQAIKSNKDPVKGKVQMTGEGRSQAIITRTRLLERFTSGTKMNWQREEGRHRLNTLGKTGNGKQGKPIRAGQKNHTEAGREVAEIRRHLSS